MAPLPRNAISGALILVVAMVVMAIPTPAAAQSSQPMLSIVEQWLDLEQESAMGTGRENQSRARLILATMEETRLLLDRHLDIGLTCESCHFGTVDEDGTEHPPVFTDNSYETCVACHGTMLEVAEGEEIVWPNPHISPHLGPDEVPQCLECHRVHEPGEVTCNLCHRGFDFQVD